MKRSELVEGEWYAAYNGVYLEHAVLLRKGWFRSLLRPCNSTIPNWHWNVDIFERGLINDTK